MTDLTLVADNTDPPHDTAREYAAACAAVRLQRVVARAMETYSAAQKKRPGLMVSAWIAERLVAECPVLETMARGE